MSSAKDALLKYEASQVAVAMSALTDSGDRTTFNGTLSPWSGRSGYAPEVRPNGVITGGVVTPAASGTDDAVDVSAATAYIGGALVTAAASTDEAVARTTSGYLLLTLAAGGYTNAVANDVGKKVVGATTSDSGTLLAYNNSTRQWLISQDDAGDVFDDDNEALSITTGTGAGAMSGVAVVPGYKISSVVMTAAGGIEVTAGHPGTALSETRGAIGGPPFIAVTSVELAQVRYSAAASADVAATEILAQANTHREVFSTPGYSIDYRNGKVVFKGALMANHTGGVAKKVYASYAQPTFADIELARDFVPAETTQSVSSQPVYGGNVGEVSSSLGQASFSAYLNDGITDDLVTLAGEKLWFKFQPNRYATPYHLTQGYLAIARTFPASGSIVASCTISAETAGANVAA